MSGDATRPPAGAAAREGLNYSVRIVADGRSIPLKEFLHDMIGGSVVGLVSGLRGVGEIGSVSIHVERLSDEGAGR